MSQTNTRKVSRPAQGINTLSRPNKPPRWSPKSTDVANATPRVVSVGKLSAPTKRGKWAPKSDAAPRVRQS